MAEQMTGMFLNREERKKSYGYFDKYNKDELVDKIYDDFESRTCENCKHYEVEPFSMGSKMICEKLRHGVASDFGCNKFERTHNV